MSKKIKTTEDLRDFLAVTMLAVKNGDIAVDRASQITKLAAQINESLYAEVKVNQVILAAAGQFSELGKLAITGSQHAQEQRRD